MALAVFVAGTAAYADQPQPKLIIYVRNTAAVPGPVLIRATWMAGRMFADIGISLVWANAKPAIESSQPPIFVELATATPESLRPGALAYALPFEGSHLTVFYDRVASIESTGILLAHVLVHEITHLLQGVDRHSATGVMKANWNNTDYDAMRYKPLPFTAFDVQLIYSGLAGRPALVAKVATR